MSARLIAAMVIAGFFAIFWGGVFFGLAEWFKNRRKNDSK